MFLTLIKHTWLGYKRSDFFSKSIAVKGIMIFVFFILVMYINMFGKMLPGLLAEHFPQRSPGQWVYSSLVFLMMMDMVIRFTSQKLPVEYVKPYLHLPVPWQYLSFIWLLRSWFHPLNIYLLFFFLPFIQLTVNPETSSQWYGLVGIFLLSIVNHSIYISIKTLVPKKSISLLISGPLILLPLAIALLYPEIIMHFSFNVFLGFVNGNHLVFASVALLIILLHLITFFNLKESSYYIYGAATSPKPGTARLKLEKKIGSHPVFGIYWLLEWRLITRNKRSKHNFWLFPFYALLAIVFFIFSNITEPGPYAVILFMIVGGYGITHLQHCFSWESRFFDFLMSRNFSIYNFLLAKYYFYFFVSWIQFLMVGIVLFFFIPSLIIIYVSMYLYVCGVGYHVYMRMGINNSCRFDPNGKASFNMEGLSGTKFLFNILLYLSIIPFFIINAIVPLPHAGSWLMGFTGLSMILFHRRWIHSLSSRLINQRYHNLALYRQK